MLIQCGSSDVFEVARFAGLQTAYSDKHPAYSIAQGPSGFGLSEGEISYCILIPSVLDLEPEQHETRKKKKRDKIGAPLTTVFLVASGYFPEINPFNLVSDVE